MLERLSGDDDLRREFAANPAIALERLGIRADAPVTPLPAISDKATLIASLEAMRRHIQESMYPFNPVNRRSATAERPVA